MQSGDHPLDGTVGEFGEIDGDHPGGRRGDREHHPGRRVDQLEGRIGVHDSEGGARGSTGRSRRTDRCFRIGRPEPTQLAGHRACGRPPGRVDQHRHAPQARRVERQHVLADPYGRPRAGGPAGQEGEYFGPVLAAALHHQQRFGDSEAFDAQPAAQCEVVGRKVDGLLGPAVPGDALVQGVAFHVELRQQAIERGWYPPGPAAQYRHDGGDEHHADDEGVDEHAHGEGEGDRFDHRVALGDEGDEHREHDDSRRGHDAATGDEACPDRPVGVPVAGELLLHARHEEQLVVHRQSEQHAHEQDR
ncbi:hypothetical protein D9V41_08925 [Aeromicrobium phragmitis]|uniref:Uncharacterized protein n=1 Tax=Aeromicrobium phragmitis TaxID=2478914 RepID=A0A3L8PKT8_9ACTN|nr:hypothetical protein D9V41_08925 [Aeromicrobium phragmitis]